MSAFVRVTATAILLAACTIGPDGRGFGGDGSVADGDSGGWTGAATTTGISAGPAGDSGKDADGSAGADDLSAGPGSAADSGDGTDDDTSAGPGSATASSSSGPGQSSSSSSDGGAPGDPLHPDLDVPDDSIETCMTPGNTVECSGIQVCRFHTTEQNLCESCDVCGNLNAPCVEGTDCDILFACFQGRCTNICPLGTFFCGPIDDCINIGHPTHGVCDPFA